MLLDIDLVLDKLVPTHLLQIGALAAQVGQAIDDILHEVKAIQIVLHPHVEGGGDRAFLLIAAHVQVAVGAAVGQPMDKPGISMEAKDDRLIRGEEGIVVGLAEPMGMFGAGLQTHQVDDVDHPGF